MSIYIIFIILVVTFLARNRRYRWFYILAKTYKRDIQGYIAIYKAKQWANKYSDGKSTMVSEFTSTAKKYLKKPALICEDEMWTYEMALQFQNKLARFFIQEGYKKGDSIALLLENSIEYPCMWLGLSQVGIITALINTNLTKRSLLHSFTVAKAKAVIFCSNYADKVAEIAGSLKTLKLYEYHSGGKVSGLVKTSTNLKLALEKVSGEELGPEYIRGQAKDPLIYIYTSGTTGLPKATVMTNIRCLIISRASMSFMQVTDEYVTYIPLPLYHLAGGIFGIGHILLIGGTVVIAKKFSATNYFKDCEKYNCNSSQYVGEMCRYLLTLPEDVPIKHQVKYLAGLGLRTQFWTKFVKRFNIERVWESYTSTEGVISLINIDNTPGSVGYIPRYLLKFAPTKLIKCDPLTGTPIRNSDGFCIECGVDEPGLAVGKINTERVTTTFEGYTDENSTWKKHLRNVFVRGDLYLNSGDILVYDELGYFYVKDRTGDTYRWKGENVSSTEVESIISEVVGLVDVVVFGVKIPEHEGTAGMAVIDNFNKSIDFETLAAKISPLLPPYAMPIFVRAADSLQLTGTYKLFKVDLKVEGYDIKKVKDPIYFYDSNIKKYVRLSKELYNKIVSGQVRV